MAKVSVVRQVVDENNNLSWATFEIDEVDLLPDEIPTFEQTIGEAPEPPVSDQTPVIP